MNDDRCKYYICVTYRRNNQFQCVCYYEIFNAQKFNVTKDRYIANIQTDILH